MGKTGRWIRNILTGKKDRERDRETKNETDYHQISRNNDRPTTPLSTTQPTTPKEKRRWSFRRSSATAPAKQDLTSADTPPVMDHNIDNNVKRQALAAASAVIQLTAATSHNPSATEESAATKIQSAFRAYLARKALNALRGLVKLQALVRGHLVRKQATETLRCMQALVMVQARARAQRLKMAEEKYFMDQTQFNPRKSTQENRFRNSNQDYEENIKIVEMDLGDYKLVTKGRNSYSNHTQTQISTPTKQEYYHHISPSPSGMTDISPRTCSNHFEDYSYGGTAQSSPQCYSAISRRSEYAESLYSECPFYPNYMANTQSSRAKVRSHSAPKQRPAAETFEKQPTRRRPSIEGRNVPRAVRMQRSSSHVGSGSGSTPQSYHYPWSVKLDRSAVSLKDSDCGSNSTVVTQNNYCRSLVGFEVREFV